jgi:hypothetical protein
MCDLEERKLNQWSRFKAQDFSASQDTKTKINPLIKDNIYGCLFHVKFSFFKINFPNFYIFFCRKSFLIKNIGNGFLYFKWKNFSKNCEKIKNILLFINYIKFCLIFWMLYSFLLFYFLILSLKIWYNLIFKSTLILLLFSFFYPFLNWNFFIYQIWFLFF